jgi:hypothetical protein
MSTLKIWAYTILCGLLSIPMANSQTVSIPVVTPKWEFGLRSGAGFSSIHLDGRNPRSEWIQIGGGRTRYGNSDPRGELYVGAFATRHFGQRWSVRSELSAVSKTYEGMSMALGVFPRYRLNSWLSLEAGIEHRLPLSNWGKSETRFSGGLVFGGKDLEFNLRFAPSYQPTTPFGRSSWLGSFQVGASYRLASVGKIFRKN